MRQLLRKPNFIHLKLLILLTLINTLSFAKEDRHELEYVSLYPPIVTNYLKKSSSTLGFIQLKVQLAVRGKNAALLLEKHMPLIREYITEFLNFTNEALIKDTSKRNQLRVSLSKGIQKMLKKEIGEPLIEDLVITHFIWN